MKRLLVRSTARITTERLLLLFDRCVAHVEAGEEELRIGAEEMFDIICELDQRRAHKCPDEEMLRRQRERTWGYDG